MRNKVITTSLLGLFYSLSVTAGSMSNTIKPSTPLFYVGGFGGYGTVSGGYKHDGNIAQGRFTLGIHAKQYKQWMLSTELGVQSS